MNRVAVVVAGAIIVLVLGTIPASAQKREGERGGGNRGDGAKASEPASAPRPAPVASPRQSPAPRPESDGGHARERRIERQDAERAVPRRSAPERRGSDPGGTAGTSTPARRHDRPPSDGTDVAIPRYSRPRGNNPVVGQAIPRGNVPIRTARSDFLYFPFYGGYYYPYSRATFSLGYFYYDPYWWGYPGYGYPSYGYPGYGYQTYAGSGFGFDVGSLRLRVKPRKAQVFVDGYYVGTVDDFDGLLQRLRLDAGPHQIEIRADGYTPASFDVLITAGETVTYRGTLTRIR